MGDRHYRGTEDREPPGVAASWWRIAFSWLVALAFLATVGPVSGDKAGAFVLFVLLFPVIALLMAVVAGMGLLALFNAFRGSGPGPGNLMFWLEVLPAAIGLLAGVQYVATLKGPW